jgi:hypothetical protein
MARARAAESAVARASRPSPPPDPGVPISQVMSPPARRHLGLDRGHHLFREVVRRHLTRAEVGVSPQVGHDPVVT